MGSGRNLLAFIVIILGAGPIPVRAVRADTIKVVIDKLVFSPAEINAKVGDTVEWVNKDILAHTATVRGAWDVMIAADKTASVVLKNAGAVDYYCRFHPNMKGRMVVAPK
jgi:plastocyanin